jgi:hypothetical protein
MVVVWLSADAGSVQVEIGRYQAHETTIDSKTVYDNAKYMFEKDYVNFILKDPMTMRPDILARVAQHGYPKPVVYDEYRERYSWKPIIILPEGSTFIKAYNQMCNGEKEKSRKSEEFFKLNERSVPSSFEVVWKDKQGQRYISNIAFTSDKEFLNKFFKDKYSQICELPLDFDKNQIRQLYKQLNKNIPIDLVIKIDPTIASKTERVTALYLQQGDKQYPLKETLTCTSKY